ncbi:hypothetical protein GQ54DRAFT_245956, partial [Martensiomyces pterosporus]
ISNTFGYLSIACWFVVLVPQIHLNAKRKSCEGVSLAFYLMWSLGDLLNLGGALMENMIQTAVLLPLYYIVTDCVVLTQFYLYRNNHSSESESDEERPLLSSQQTSGSSSSSLAKRKRSSWYIRPLLALAAVLLAVTFIAHLFATNPEWLAHIDLRKAIAQSCGYLSAAVYLGAYIPQLVQNYRSKSTEGLSIFMFLLVILANLTYCMSILTAQRPTYEFLKKYAPWLLGAAGTIWLELGVLYQFYIY